MNLKRAVAVIDTHTAGEPTRIVIGGGPQLRGSTIKEKWLEFREKHQAFREFVVREPRGHSDMYGAFLVPPASPEAHFGVLFMDIGGSKPMCGHGSMGVAYTAVQLGLIPKIEPFTEVCLETPAGLIYLHVDVTNGVVGDVQLQNVASFVVAREVEIPFPPPFGKGKVDISFGGNFFAFTDANALGLKLEIFEIEKIRALGIDILNAVNKSITVEHPEDPTLNKVTNIVFSLEIPGKIAKNVEVGINGNIDRSPCGTGTSAKMALLAEQGKLSPQEVFFHESFIGTVFSSFYQPGPVIGGKKTILPFIRGKAYITGFNWLLLEETDNFARGFCISRTS